MPKTNLQRICVNGCQESAATLVRGTQLDATTGTQPSGCRGLSIAPCCCVNAAILFADLRMLMVELIGLHNACLEQEALFLELSQG